jgi:hypothetical protein
LNISALFFYELIVLNLQPLEIVSVVFSLGKNGAYIVHIFIIVIFGAVFCAL